VPDLKYLSAVLVVPDLKYLSAVLVDVRGPVPPGWR
jgi:hypothetical protein